MVTISRRLGHAFPAITSKVYAHLFRKDDGKTAAAINSALAGSPSPDMQARPSRTHSAAKR